MQYLNITIRKNNSENEKLKTLWFQSDEETLYEVSNELRIEMTTESNCYIENSVDKNCNIDELNYLMKRLCRILN